MAADEEEFVLQAIAYDNAELLEELLAENPSLANHRDGRGRTPLHHAAAGGHTNCAEVLIRTGADLEAVAGPQDTVKTPLVLAAAMGRGALVELLIGRGADMFYFDSEGHSALQLAQINGHGQVAGQLIASIECIYAEADEKNQRLCCSCVDGELGTVLEILTELGPKSIRSRVLNGQTPADQKSALYLAAEHGRLQIVQILLTVIDHSIIFEPTGDTLLHAAISSQNLETVEIIVRKFPFLMNAANADKNLPIHWACNCGNAEILRLLLELKYPFEELKFFKIPRIERAGEGYLFPCDLNATDQEGRTALYLAVMKGHLDVVRVMSNHKVCAVNREAELIVQSANDGLDRMQCPIDFNIYVNGRTPLMVACANGDIEIVRILLRDCKVSPNLAISEEKREFERKSDEENGQSLKGKEFGGALAEAAKNGHAEVVKLLFQYGAFDHKNRALRELSTSAEMDRAKQRQMIGLFLQTNVFQDRDCTSNKLKQQKIGEEESPRTKPIGWIRAVAENVLNASIPAECFPNKMCQLNWKEAGLRELHQEWMVSSALGLNPNVPRQFGKSLSLLMISRIDLSGNQLCSVPHFLFTQLSSLRALDLSKNELHRLDMPMESADWQSTSLQTLCLDENQLEELPSQLFSNAHFPQLRLLSTQRNRLRRLPVAVWSALRLRELHLANNQISELHTLLDARRRSQQHHQQRVHHGAAGGTAARISRQRQREAADSGGSRVEAEERQSRPSTKRESPNQQHQSGSRRSSAGGDGTGSDGRLSTGRSTEKHGWGGVLDMDIVRVNVWQDKIQLSNIDDCASGEEIGETCTPEKGGDSNRYSLASSSLQLLDLAGNKLSRMPTCLACCCPRLSKLNVSSNLLNSLGPVECLPSALRHLDASHNKLIHLFGAENTAQFRQKLRHCEQPQALLNSQSGGIASPGSVLARNSRSRSKSVARSQRSLSVARTSGGIIMAADQTDPTSAAATEPATSACCCVHKSHCRLEALRTLNLAHNLLSALDVLVPLSGGGGSSAAEAGTSSSNTELINMILANTERQDGNNDQQGHEFKQFSWRESGEQLKPYVLFPSLTNLDLSQNRLCQLSPTISLLSSLAVLNLSENAALEKLIPELGMLDRLWNIGLGGCLLGEEEPALRAIVRAGNYKTGEVLAQLRQRLEKSIPYPKLKLMFLGGSSVGKTALLQQMRMEGTATKRRTLNESWARRMGHSPVKASPHHRTASQQRLLGFADPTIYPVDVTEWTYEPIRSSKSAPPPSTNAFQGTITFRAWDFDGIKQREYFPVELCFFTRRCLFLLLWKVTDGEIALVELHEWLLAIQERSPNSNVLIVGTHSDFVREHSQHFPRDYLAQLDKQIQERFMHGADPEKNGLPRVLGSLYISCRCREDVKSLCSLIYTCAAEIRCCGKGGGGQSRQRQLSEKVPASFMELERIVVTMTDEFRAAGREPIMHFNEFWGMARERMLLVEEQRGGAAGAVHFRGAQDFRQACLFLHENGVLCYFDDIFLGNFVFLDPPWLCALLHATLAFATTQRRAQPAGAEQTTISQVHQNSVIESVELYSALKRAIRQHLSLIASSSASSSDHLSSPSDQQLYVHSRLLRICTMHLLRKFELALPFQCGRMSLLASCLPDEYSLRADYPGSKVRVRNKFDKLKLRWKCSSTGGASTSSPRSSKPPTTPVRNYLEHRRLTRTTTTTVTSIDDCTENGGRNGAEMAIGDDFARILMLDHCKEECLRRLYVMHYIPPGFWAQFSTRMLDDERVGNVLSKLFTLSRVVHQHSSSNNDQNDQQEDKMISSSLERTLNAGRIVSLLQRNTKNRFSTDEEEEETSFMLVNRAEEVTEETNKADGDGNKIEEDEEGPMMVKCCERGMEASDVEERVGTVDGNGLEWMLWRSGIEVRCLGTFVLSLRQFLPLASVPDVNYSSHDLRRRLEDGQWGSLTTVPSNSAADQHPPALTHMIELLVPKVKIRCRWRESLWELETDVRMAAAAMALFSAVIDDLLEEHWPQLGTRFILSPRGRLLVDRLIPCDRCAIEAIREEERYWIRENINRNPKDCGRSNNQHQHKYHLPSRQPPTRSASSSKFKHNNAPKRMPKSKSTTEGPLNVQSQKFAAEEATNSKVGLITDRNVPKSVSIHLFSIEECILEARKKFKSDQKREMISGAKGEPETRLECARHGPIGWRREKEESPSSSLYPDLARMAPDLLFADLENDWVIPLECIRRGKLLGRGAFGLVFTGWMDNVPIRKIGQFGKIGENSAGKTADAAVALKLFEPIEPNSEMATSRTGGEQAAIRAFELRWQSDLLEEQSTKAYCTARRELCMLSELRHPHCTSMLAFCASPMILLMELAPKGSLDKLLADFRQCGQKLQLETLQRSGVQIARALEYLHLQQHIIYRDLKSENVLVWRFPAPAVNNNNINQQHVSEGKSVLLKLGDYGISRFTHPFGMCKGYAGTEGFMAPEIMRYNGEQEYTERVDTFSFGMFLYELLTLKQPYEGQPVQQMKERIMEAQRPAVSEKELLYATNMLDLMVACWEERADCRPSSSQLVEICSAPEFAHLLDVALLRDGESSSPFLATSFSDGEMCQWACWMSIEERRHHLLRRMFAQFHCNQFGWTEKKLVFGPYDRSNVPSNQNSPAKRRSPHSTSAKSSFASPLPKITAIAKIFDDFVWLGDESGQLNIYTLSEELHHFPQGPPMYRLDTAKVLENNTIPGQCVQFQREEKSAGHEQLRRVVGSEQLQQLQGSSSSAECSASPVRHIQSFPERQIVVVGVPNSVILFRWSDPSVAPPNPITSILLGDSADQLVKAMTLLPSLGDWQIWTGHPRGLVFIHFISSATDRLAFSTSINHYGKVSANNGWNSNVPEEGSGSSNRCAVTFLVASNCVKNLVWSVMERDARLFMWRDAQLQKTLNCSKILPFSESLSSMDCVNMNTDSAGQQQQFVTAMELLNLGEDREQLLIGTSLGIVLIIRAQEMHPISAFRPYSGSISVLSACVDPSGQSSTNRILQNELISSTIASSSSSTSISSSSNQQHPSKKRSIVIEKSRAIILKATGQQHPKLQQTSSMPGGGAQISDIRTAAVDAVDEICEAVKNRMRGIFSTEKSKTHENSGREAYFVSIGRGYRPLLNRFVNSSTLNAALGTHSADEDCAIFWRTNWDWSQQSGSDQ